MNYQILVPLAYASSFLSGFQAATNFDGLREDKVPPPGGVLYMVRRGCAVPQATKQGAEGGQPFQSVSNGDMTYTYTYDLKNRPISKTDSRTGLRLSYVYDYAGNVYSRTNYDSTTSEYRYDGADRLVGERNQDFLQASYHYDPAGRLLDRILSNGSKTAYTYDNNNRLLSLKNTTANDTVVNDTAYVRDRLGNITSQTEGSNTTAFTYDALYRLTAADYPGTANDQAFTHDHVGNRRTKVQNGVTLAYVYDAGNRLKEIRQGSDTGPIQNSFVYDDDGNMIQKKNSGGAVIQSIAYDAKGRAKTITTSGIGTATTLTYDPYDHRIAKTDSTGTRRYLLEGEHLEATLDGSNDWKAMYLRGAVIDEIVNAYYFDVNNRWVNYTFSHDVLQSVLGISGHEGTVLQTIAYGPFGEKINVTGSAPNNYLHYTGRETDLDTGFYNYRARLYDPTVGRFITEDPKGFDAGVNFYTYVQNNPVNGNDPYGWDTKITIGYTKTPVPGTSHQVVILTDTVTGKQYATRGGPECFLCGGLGFGSIKAQSDWYNSTFKDKPSNVYTTQEVGVIKRDFADSVSNAINFRDITNQNQIPYWPLGPNSNSYASTFVESLTGTRPAPIVTAPGADMGQPSPNLNYKPSPIINTGGATGSWDSGATGSWDSSSAAGGYVLYPNKPNTNMMQSVYSKEK